MILVDHAGEVVDGDETLYIIAKTRRDALNGAVVGTQMSNLGLERAVRELGLDFLRAKVGDRYIMELLLERGLQLGGESSGHIINRNLSSTGDGILSALQVIEAMVGSGRTLHELKRGMQKLPQRLVNIKLNSMPGFSSCPEIDEAVRQAERELNGRGRVLLRPSGTEPLLRIMVEGEDAMQVDSLISTLAGRVESALAGRV